MKTIVWLALMSIAPVALAHGGHWHLDEETLEKIFATADAVYGWFAANSLIIAAAIVVVLSAWFPWWWYRRGRARKK